MNISVGHIYRSYDGRDWRVESIDNSGTKVYPILITDVKTGEQDFVNTFGQRREGKYTVGDLALDVTSSIEQISEPVVEVTAPVEVEVVPVVQRPHANMYWVDGYNNLFLVVSTTFPGGSPVLTYMCNEYGEPDMESWVRFEENGTRPGRDTDSPMNLKSIATPRRRPREFWLDLDTRTVWDNALSEPDSEPINWIRVREITE
jgi:hypothetical protein